MIVIEADESNIDDWEWEPRYRVALWDGSIPEGITVSWFILDGCKSVEEAIAWTRSQPKVSSPAVYMETRTGNSREITILTLVWGQDLTLGPKHVFQLGG